MTPADATPRPPTGTRPHILLADDNADMRQYVRRLLSDRYEVTAVADGVAARDAARAELPDLILSDVMMPGLDGFGLLRELRADDRTRSLPVLLLSARAGEEARVEGLRAGADDYLTKPFSARELLARVEGQLQMAWLRRESEQTVRESEERFRGIFDQTIAGIAQTDLTGRFTHVNGRYCELVGRPAVELYDLRMQDITHPEDLPGNLELFGRMIGGGEPFVIEKRYVRPDGTHVWVSNSVSLIRDRQGGPKYVVAVSLDITEQKRAEELLRQSEGRLRTIFEQSAAGIAQVDPTGRFLLVNQRFCEITGYTARELHERTCGSLTYPEDRGRDGSLFEAALADRRPYVVEKRYIRKDGSPVWVRNSVSVVTEGDGPTHLLAVTIDITDRKRAEQERERFFTVGADMLVVAGFDGYFKQVSPACERTLGWTAAELTSRPWADLLHPDDRAATVALNSQAQQGQEVLSFENRYRHKDGSYRWLNWKARVYPAEGVIFAGATDITVRKRAEALQAGQLHVLELIAQGTPLPDVLGAVCRLIEGQQEDLLCSILLTDESGRHTGTGIGPSLPDDFVRALQGIAIAPPHTGSCCKALDCGVEVLVADIENDRRWSPLWRDLNLSHGLRACRSIPISGSDGRMLASVAVFRRQPGDPGPANKGLLGIATHLAGIAIERRRAEEGLREADRRKDEFLALLAHELRNPLAPIRNGLHVMRLAGHDAQAVEQARTMMERQLTQLVRIVDDLLDVSRITRNKMELRRGPVELAAVVQSAVETSRPAIEEQGHVLTVDLPPEPVHLDADLTRLAQVFANLLNNSAKYTPPGGRIRLAAERRGQEVVVWVEDTGIGIPEGSLDRIFDMFSQVDRTLERSTGGLGIGLSLVKGLVEMHGGTVEATSGGEGKGSTFTVCLPICLGGPRPDVQGGGSGQAVSAPRRRVLVVDDNRDSAESLAMLLRLSGNEVRTAHDGLEAVEVAGDYRPDLILMDVGMPRLNGLDATRRIREQPWGKNAVIVALTGWGQDGDRQRTTEAGGDAHLVKPVDPEALERLLAESHPRWL